MSNNVAFQITTKKDIFEGNVATDVATKKNKTTNSNVVTIYEDSDKANYEDTESDKSDVKELSIKDIQKAYQEMYDNFIKVCDVNKSLKDKLFKLVDENEELKDLVFNLKSLMKEKDEKVQELTAKLDSTKKNLRMLNSRTTKLDHILNIGQSMNNQNGIGFSDVIDSVATKSKTVFVKAIPTPINPLMSGKIVRPPMLEVKVKRFVPICHFCNMPGHIHPKYFV